MDERKLLPTRPWLPTAIVHLKQEASNKVKGNFDKCHFL
jgi:catechol-2,3-dioxygenase